MNTRLLIIIQLLTAACLAAVLWTSTHNGWLTAAGLFALVASGLATALYRKPPPYSAPLTRPLTARPPIDSSMQSAAPSSGADSDPSTMTLKVKEARLNLLNNELKNTSATLMAQSEALKRWRIHQRSKNAQQFKIRQISRSILQKLKRELDTRGAPLPGSIDSAMSSLHFLDRAGSLTQFRTRALRNEDSPEQHNLWHLIDDVLELVAPLLNVGQRNCAVILNTSEHVSINAEQFKHSLFALLTACIDRVEAGALTLQVERQNERLVITPGPQGRYQTASINPGLLQLTGATWDGYNLSVPAAVGIPAAAQITAEPSLSTLTALVIAEPEMMRQHFVQRLNALGIACVEQFQADKIDLCLVMNETSDTFLSIEPYLAGKTPVLLLNNRRLYQDPLRIQISEPATQRELGQVCRDLVMQTGDRGQLRILIADDSDANRLLLANQLTESGYRVDTTTNGNDAERLTTSGSFDLVLMDIQMPGTNGTEATEHIRRTGNKTPIVGLTAHATDEETSHYLSTGMNEVLIKPVRLEKLQRLIKRLTSRETGRTPKRPAKSASTRLTDSENSIFDLSLALSNAGDRYDLAQEMLELLMETLPQDQQSIIDTASNRTDSADSAELKKSVHKLHGAVRYSGVPRLQAALEKLETSLKQNNRDQTKILVNLVIGEITALQQWYRNHPDIIPTRDNTLTKQTANTEKKT